MESFENLVGCTCFFNPWWGSRGVFRSLWKFSNFSGAALIPTQHPSKDGQATTFTMNWHSVARHSDFVENFLVCSYSQRTNRFFFCGGSSENHMATHLGQGDKDGMMPLHWAADRGDLEMVPSPKSKWPLVVGVFSSDFFWGVRYREEESTYHMWESRSLVQSCFWIISVLGLEFFLVTGVMFFVVWLGCWVNSLSFAEVWVSTPLKR